MTAKNGRSVTVYLNRERLAGRVSDWHDGGNLIRFILVPASERVGIEPTPDVYPCKSDAWSTGCKSGALPLGQRSKG